MCCVATCIEKLVCFCDPRCLPGNVLWEWKRTIVAEEEPRLLRVGCSCHPGSMLGSVAFMWGKSRCLVQGSEGFFSPSYLNSLPHVFCGSVSWCCYTWHSLYPSLGTQHRKGGDIVEGVHRGGPWGWSKGWSSSAMNPDWGNWGCSVWNREGCGETSLWPYSI